MMHDQWTDRLSEYLDDELSAEERRDLDVHLQQCGHCSTTLSELRQVAARAAALPTTPPDADLWTGIAERMKTPPRFSFTLPQLAAAALALMVGSGWLALRLVTPDVPPAVADARPADPERSGTAASGQGEPAIIPASFADAQYDAAVADLEAALESGRARLDPSTVTVLEENLALIDRAIEESRQALETDPASTYVSRHLMQTRRAKLDLLRHAAALTVDFN